MPTTVSDDKIVNVKTIKVVKQKLAEKIPSTEKGAASGVASLNSNGKIPTSQIQGGNVVNAVASGSTDGTISITVNGGTATEVAVAGLEDGAFSEIATTAEIRAELGLNT